MKTVPASAGLRSAGPRPAWSTSPWAVMLWAHVRGPALDRQQINAAASQIEALATRLRDGKPVRAEGVARLRALLCDGAGPVYTPSRSPDLPGALDAVARWLDVED